MLSRQRDSLWDAPDLTLRINHRELKDATVYLLFNESVAPMTHTVTVKSSHRHVEVWDESTGAIEKKEAQSSGDGLHFTIELAPYQSSIVVLR